MSHLSIQLCALHNKRRTIAKWIGCLLALNSLSASARTDQEPKLIPYHVAVCEGLLRTMVRKAYLGEALASVRDAAYRIQQEGRTLEGLTPGWKELIPSKSPEDFAYLSAPHDHDVLVSNFDNPKLNRTYLPSLYSASGRLSQLERDLTNSRKNQLFIAHRVEGAQQILDFFKTVRTNIESFEQSNADGLKFLDVVALAHYARFRYPRQVIQVFSNLAVYPISIAGLAMVDSGSALSYLFQGMFGAGLAYYAAYTMPKASELLAFLEARLESQRKWVIYQNRYNPGRAREWVSGVKLAQSFDSEKFTAANKPFFYLGTGFNVSTRLMDEIQKANEQKRPTKLDNAINDDFVAGVYHRRQAFQNNQDERLLTQEDFTFAQIDHILQLERQSDGTEVPVLTTVLRFKDDFKYSPRPGKRRLREANALNKPMVLVPKPINVR